MSRIGCNGVRQRSVCSARGRCCIFVQFGAALSASSHQKRCQGERDCERNPFHRSAPLNVVFEVDGCEHVTPDRCACKEILLVIRAAAECEFVVPETTGRSTNRMT